MSSDRGYGSSRFDRERSDREFLKRLDSDLKVVRKDVKKLDKEESRLEKKQDKESRKEVKEKEKREKKAAKQVVAKKMPPPPPATHLLPCMGKAIQCICPNGTISDVIGRCGGSNPNLFAMACPPGEIADGLGRCSNSQPFAGLGRNCNALFEMLSRLDHEKQTLEQMLNETCSLDPNAARCPDLRSEYSGVIEKRNRMQERYDQCRRSRN